MMRRNAFNIGGDEAIANQIAEAANKIRNRTEKIVEPREKVQSHKNNLAEIVEALTNMANENRQKKPF